MRRELPASFFMPENITRYLLCAGINISADAVLKREETLLRPSILLLSFVEHNQSVL